MLSSSILLFSIPIENVLILFLIPHFLLSILVTNALSIPEDKKVP